MLSKPRVVVADDNSKILSVVSRVLSEQCDIVGEAVDGEQTVEATLRLRPDILVLDISMPGMGGFEVARRLAAAGAAVTIVFLTGLEEREYIDEALRLGARGYVFKRRLSSDLPLAIRAAVEGRTFYPAIHRPAPPPPEVNEVDRAASHWPPSRYAEPAPPAGRSAFLPGDVAPLSGIYQVIHPQCDFGRHYVTVLYGEVFPRCPRCTAGVRFELILAAVYIKTHPLFQDEK